jgi:hypothetical protein
MERDGLWLLGSGEGEFRRTDGNWLHARDAGRWHGLSVPGARDVTFGELHGHRILDPRQDPTLERHHWQLRGDALYLRFADVIAFPELTWARTPNRQQHPTLGLLCGFTPREWDKRRSAVAGMWAPQLVKEDFRGALATTGLEERAAERDAQSAAGYRRALMRRGTEHFRLSHRALAAAAGVSRGRVDQILREAGGHGEAAAASASSADEVLKRLTSAASNHRHVRERLDATRRARAAAVQEARREKMSLAQIALCLGVTRGRVQQLARA